jgi:WD40 repeat protein
MACLLQKGFLCNVLIIGREKYDQVPLYWHTLQNAILTQCSPAETRAFIFLSSVRAVAFSPDGTEIASGGDDAYIRIWGYRVDRTGHFDVITPPRELEGHTKRYELNPKEYSLSLSGSTWKKSEKSFDMKGSSVRFALKT